MFCEQYLAESLTQELGLKRERLALLALLLGSDYTEGISGIGIVNAMETIATYPSLDELKSFREWLESPDLDAFRAVTKAAKKGKRGGSASLGIYILHACSHLCVCIRSLLRVVFECGTTCPVGMWK